MSLFERERGRLSGKKTASVVNLITQTNPSGNPAAAAAESLALLQQ